MRRKPRKRLVNTPACHAGAANVKEARATWDTAIEQGKQFISEKKSVLSAAFEAGKEAMKQPQPRG